MKAYLASLALGLLAGLIYSLFNVRSTAPPVIALVGLLGMLIGEQIPSFAKQLWPLGSVSAVVDRQIDTRARGPSGRAGDDA